MRIERKNGWIHISDIIGEYLETRKYMDYTEDEIDYICMYYGQIPDNLTYNMKIMFVEKLEDEIENKVEQIKNRRS